MYSVTYPKFHMLIPLNITSSTNDINHCLLSLTPFPFFPFLRSQRSSSSRHGLIESPGKKKKKHPLVEINREISGRLPMESQLQVGENRPKNMPKRLAAANLTWHSQLVEAKSLIEFSTVLFHPQNKNAIIKEISGDVFLSSTQHIL